jgi:hypothetical protein
MKGLAFFLSFYIVLLSIFTCADVVKSNTIPGIEFSQNTTAPNHNNIDQCSPFCACQCCQANFYVSHIPISASSDEIGVMHYEYISDFHSIDLFDFLIPPKA